MSILSKLKQPSLSPEGREAVQRRQQYIERLVAQGLDESDLVFKSTAQLQLMVSTTTKARTKTLEERDQDRIFEYHIKQLSKN